MSAPALTKKQLKTLAFRAKQKNQAAPVDDVPEVDLLDDTDEVVPEPKAVVAEGSKKRKREGEDPSGKGKAKEVVTEGEAKDGEAEEQQKKKTKKDVKQRFILFVGAYSGVIVLDNADDAGNLGFRTTAKQIAVHFKEAVGKFACPHTDASSAADKR